jgi:preprotein translocase subunit SecE
MAKSQNSTSVWSEFFQLGLYKRNQGRLTRQLTAVTIVIVLVYGAWMLSQGPLSEANISIDDFAAWVGRGNPAAQNWVALLIRRGIPFAIVAAGAWFAYRLVNIPRFADFLISVEAEMDKVSWASKDEVFRATVVVVTTMLFLGAVLFVYDVFWSYFFELIGFLRMSGTS